MKKAIISRTIITNAVHVNVFDKESRTARADLVMLPAAIDTAERAEKYIRKNPALIGSAKLIDVESVERIENLVGMYVDDFIANAKPVTERSKETRGTITKTVQSCIGTALYMSAGRKIEEMTVTFPANVTNVNSYICKNYTIPGKYIDVEDVETIDSLYSMDENTFIRLAKPMKNKFQLAD